MHFFSHLPYRCPLGRHIQSLLQDILRMDFADTFNNASSAYNFMVNLTHLGRLFRPHLFEKLLFRPNQPNFVLESQKS